MKARIKSGSAAYLIEYFKFLDIYIHHTILVQIQFDQPKQSFSLNMDEIDLDKIMLLYVIPRRR